MRDNRDGRSRGAAGCQGGCAGCGCVLTVGLILALIGSAVGISLSARIPGTHSNITVAGSIGKKNLTKTVLPPYARDSFGKSNNFVNSSNLLTVWQAQGLQEVVLGKQSAAPVAGIEIKWKRE